MTGLFAGLVRPRDEPQPQAVTTTTVMPDKPDKPDGQARQGLNPKLSRAV